MSTPGSFLIVRVSSTGHPLYSKATCEARKARIPTPLAPSLKREAVSTLVRYLAPLKLEKGGGEDAVLRMIQDCYRKH